MPQAVEGLDGCLIQFSVPAGLGYLHPVDTTIRLEDEGQDSHANGTAVTRPLRVTLLPLDRPLQLSQIGRFRLQPPTG